MRLRRRRDPEPTLPRVTLYSRLGCHLCEAAEEVVARVCADLGEQYSVVLVDDDPELQRRFTDEVPVTFVDGRQHDFWRVDETRLRAALG
ncbi:glutaredoxin family protein [Nocardioides plantarum]|uniref:Glutaredoxin family protein n=1 Tax=Nocardioides plantarum TaxID=29299 RepID=A0ABV5K9R9_9ACTN|nr:glutaredoxin family protein [Nocardioides plantarum]